ncbi:MAG: hypothetical protein EOM20_18430, partial [Spartobacteria bacterium]|nr:hypothetical protein [Spartobacteria bacterium]
RTDTPNNPAVLVLFSGGRDSLAAAAYYLMRQCPVILYTFDNGAERHLELSEQTATALSDLFPGICRRQSASSVELFHEIAVASLEDDIRRFGHLICVGCKLAMLTLAIAYSRAHHIGIIADGFRAGQDYYPEQTPEFIEITAAFAAAYDIRYEHPIYGLDEPALEQRLADATIHIEPRQAACLFGFNRTRNPNIRAYLEAKLPLARRFLQNTDFE